MTLTISMAAPGLLVQSADHRLIDLSSGAILDDAERKQLIVSIEDGAAAISFAGVGAVAKRGRASEILYRAAVDAGSLWEVSMDQLLESLRKKSTAWLRGVHGDTRHSFVVAGFDSTATEIVTRLSLVSNYQCLSARDGPILMVSDTAPRATFQISTSLVTEPTVLVAGMHHAVLRSDRLALARMAHSRRQAIQIARRMAYVNRAAASTAEAWGAVSPHCTTVSLLVTPSQISGMTRAHTDLEREVPIEMVSAGLDERAFIANGIREAWRELRRTDTPYLLGSSTCAISLRGRTQGSPYASTSDALFVDAPTSLQL